MPEDRPVQKRSQDPAGPEPRLSSSEMEVVIARAIELQARQDEPAPEDGIGATELIRIAGELGISPAHVQQAIAEVRGKPAADTGLIARMFGEARVAVSRLVSMPVPTAREQLDRYLQEREAMVVQRRLADRIIYERGSGVGAAVTRAAGIVGARHPLLNARLLDVTVSLADERSCFVALAVDLATQRSGTIAGVAAGGVVGTAAAAGLGVVLAPPLALLGLPVLGGFVYLMRASYENTVVKTRTQLESLLDRLEHFELVQEPSAGLLRRFGL